MRSMQFFLCSLNRGCNKAGKMEGCGWNFHPQVGRSRVERSFKSAWKMLRNVEI